MNNQITFTKKLVTPEIATRLLSLNEKNRKLRDFIVSHYSRQMVDGVWKEDTGEAIKVSKSGRLIDGQHRMAAVVKSGVSLYFHFVENIDDDVFDVLDTGFVRNSADVFDIKEIKNGHVIPSVIVKYLMIKSGKANTRKTANPSNSELLAIYNKNQDFWQEIARETLFYYDRINKLIPPSLIGGFYAAITEIAPLKSKHFMDQLCGVIGFENSTIGLMISRLVQDKTSIKKIQSGYKVALLIKTWNSYIMGVNLKSLKYQADNEEFPVLKSFF